VQAARAVGPVVAPPTCFLCVYFELLLP